MSQPDRHDPYVVALGAYLRARRLARGLTHTQMAAAGQMSVAQVQRIEAGVIDTAGTTLIRLLGAVGGTLDDVLTILFDLDPTPEKARALVDEPATPPPASRLATLVAAIERDAARDPELIAALLGFLAGRRSAG